jgi:hypothetical protein
MTQQNEQKLLRFNERMPAALICQRLDDAASIPKEVSVILQFTQVNFDMAILSSTRNLFRKRPKHWDSLIIWPVHGSSTQWPLIIEQLLQPLNELAERNQVSISNFRFHASRLPTQVYQWLATQSIFSAGSIVGAEIEGRAQILALFPELSSSSENNDNSLNTTDRETSSSSMRLEKLRLFSVMFPDGSSECFELFAKGISGCSTIRDLSVIECYVPDNDLSMLFQTDRKFSLEQVDLSSSYLQESTILAISQQLVQQDCPLQTLILSDPLLWDNRQYMSNLFRALAVNTSLKELQIANNFLRDFDIVNELFQALRQNSSLKVLDLGGNNLPGEAIEALGDMLRKNTGLQRIRLNGNSIAPPDMQHLINGTRHNTTLEYLTWDKESPLLIEYWCLLNRCGRRFMKQPDSIPLGLWSHLLARPNQEQQPDVAYQFLRYGPVLLR